MTTSSLGKDFALEREPSGERLFVASGFSRTEHTIVTVLVIVERKSSSLRHRSVRYGGPSLRSTGLNVAKLGRVHLRHTLVCGGLLLSVACGSSPTSPSNSSSPSSSSAAGPAGSSSGVQLVEDFGGRPLFPSDNWWNVDISSAPADPQSNAYIDFIGRTRASHPDFGPPPYGIPYVAVSGNQAHVPVTFVAYGGESDSGFGGETGYPVPPVAATQPGFIEGGTAGGGSSGDRHLLIVDRDRWRLFELFAARWNGGAQRWEADSGAIFDLSSNARRPEGWTSADAAGLAILPGLVRYDEAVRGPIRHAVRVAVRATNGSVWPASHRAGSSPGALPMGARLRLKASKDLSGYPAYIRNIFRGMQTNGLIVADNGSDLYITGATDARWNNNELNPAFGTLRADDFDVIQLGWR
jgi:hypothetical protein